MHERYLVDLVALDLAQYQLLAHLLATDQPS